MSKKKQDVLDRVLEQEWVVTEDGKEILEMLVSQIRTLRKLVKNLKKQIKELDSKQDLQSEIEALQARIQELEDRNTITDVLEQSQPEGVAVTGLCTPYRGMTITGGTDWNDARITVTELGGMSYTLRNDTSQPATLNTLYGTFDFKNVGEEQTLPNGASATYDGNGIFTVTTPEGDKYRTSSF